MSTVHPFPQFYQDAIANDPDRAAKMFRPDEETIIKAALQSTWEPTARDKKNGKQIALLMIDPQCDFVFPADAAFPGSLSVPGAVGDMQRIAELIYKHGDKISRCFASLDTHYLYQIFHRLCWRDNETGGPVTPWRVITDDDIKSGRVSPLFEPKWASDYPAQLAKTGKKMLAIWPEHCLEISAGSAMVPTVAEAFIYHSTARRSQVNILRKGNEPRTEMYGILKPEVLVPDSQFPTAHGLNQGFLKVLSDYDEIWVGGEASSHCVLETLEQLYQEFATNSPDALSKVRILTDCTSPVQPIPDGQGGMIDFPAIAKARFDFFQSQGFQLTTSAEVAL